MSSDTGRTVRANEMLYTVKYMVVFVHERRALPN